MKFTEIEAIIKRNSHISLFGSFAQQRPEVLNGFNNLFNLTNISNIIEIGTHDGGLSTFFSLYCWNSRRKVESNNLREGVLYKDNTHHKSPKNFNTFDINIHDGNAIKLIELLEGKFNFEDCFSETGKKKIIDLINQEGKTLLLCDGGDKIKEINTFAPYLKSGDFIMGHDYFRSEFEENLYFNKIWYNNELSYSDIAETLINCNIYEIPELSMMFDKLVWFIGMKK